MAACRWFFIAVFLGLATHTLAYSPGDWERLNRVVEERCLALDSLIAEADGKGIVTDYAAVSRQVIATFRRAAHADHSDVESVRKIFQGFRHYEKTDPRAADKLAFDELAACIEVAEHAMAELRKQLDQEIELTPPPDVSVGTMELGLGYYRLDGRIVFPSSLVWLPKEEGLMQAVGRLGDGFFRMSQLQNDGTPSQRAFRGSIESVEEQRKLNAAPMVFLMGHDAPGWMEEKNPEILHGARNFTQYDIDSPVIRSGIKALCSEVIPALSEACGDQPMVHLLANEPHFATREHGWLSKNGLSDHTMRRYHRWLSAKYKTIDALNKIYGTAYDDFAHVKMYKERKKKYSEEEKYRARQIPSEFRGEAVWYDWCRFNMDRVNNWFAFLKQQVQAHDPKRSPVTIKMLGFTLSRDQRDGGMDIETLTKLQDVAGADLRVVPQGAEFFGKHEEGHDVEQGWMSRYAYDWVEQSMYLDFTKSLCPDKLFYDSEWHGFSAVSWRHFNLDRDYVRSALWMAFSHGMGAIKPWLWGREADGSLNDKANHIGELATQPVAVDAYGRTMKELNAHADRVAAVVPKERRFLIYYCEEAAIQDEKYTGQFKDIYEALKLLNVSVGFTTPSEIHKLNQKHQTLIVPPTKYISGASLSRLLNFEQAGGRVVLVGADQSFQKNELGASRSPVPEVAAVATLALTSAVELADDLEQIVAPFRQTAGIHFATTGEAGEPAYGVMIHQVQEAESGGWIMLMNNVSKDRRRVALLSDEDQPIVCTDLITRGTISGALTLGPCEVRLLMIDE